VEFHGIGLRHGDWLVVGWSSTKNQSGFGVIDYALEGNSAQGRWTAFGTDKLTFEILERDGQ
jgi:hypothetical protein